MALGIHHRLGTGMDLAIFDQGVRSLSQGHWPTSAMKSVGMNLWGDHFHPVIALAAPLYWLWDDPRMLLVAQAAAMGLGVAVLVRTARRVLTGRSATALAVLLGLGLAAAPGTQWSMVYDVHEVAFGVPLLALALASLVEGRWRAFTPWTLTVLLVKEDVGLLVLVLGVVAFLLGRRALGVMLAFVATVWTVVVLATGLVALRSPLVLVLLPSLGARVISGNPAYWGIAYHYNLLPSLVLAFAALDGLRRTAPPVRRVAAGLMLVAVICLGLVLTLLPIGGLWWWAHHAGKFPVSDALLAGTGVWLVYRLLRVARRAPWSPFAPPRDVKR